VPLFISMLFGLASSARTEDKANSVSSAPQDKGPVILDTTRIAKKNAARTETAIVVVRRT
jgi:hypothetical protein